MLTTIQVTANRRLGARIHPNGIPVRIYDSCDLQVRFGDCRMLARSRQSLNGSRAGIEFYGFARRCFDQDTPTLENLGEAALADGGLDAHVPRRAG